MSRWSWSEGCLFSLRGAGAMFRGVDIMWAGGRNKEGVGWTKKRERFEPARPIIASQLVA